MLHWDEEVSERGRTGIQDKKEKEWQDEKRDPRIWADTENIKSRLNSQKFLRVMFSKNIELRRNWERTNNVYNQ